MVIIDANTIHDHSAMMVVLDATSSALRAVVGPWQLIRPTSLAILQLSIIFHLVIDNTLWWERIIENHSLVSVFK